MVEKAVGYILLSYNEDVDVNRGKFDENGEELPYKIVNFPHFIEIRYSRVRELCTALETIRKERNPKAIIKREELNGMLEKKSIVVSSVVISKDFYSEFLKKINRAVYQKYKSSLVKSGDRNFNLPDVDFVENAQVSSNAIIRDFKNAKKRTGKVNFKDVEAVKEKLLTVAESYGFKAINIEDFTTVDSEINWECDKGHIFKKGYKEMVHLKKPDVIICDHCKEEKKNMVKNKHIKRIKAYAEKNLLEPNLSEFINAKSVITWTCKVDSSHVKKADIYSVLDYKFACRKCKREAVYLDIEE